MLVFGSRPVWTPLWIWLVLGGFPTGGKEVTYELWESRPFPGTFSFREGAFVFGPLGGASHFLPGNTGGGNTEGGEPFSQENGGRSSDPLGHSGVGTSLWGLPRRERVFYPPLGRAPVLLGDPAKGGRVFPHRGTDTSLGG